MEVQVTTGSPAETNPIIPQAPPKVEPKVEAAPPEHNEPFYKGPFSEAKSPEELKQLAERLERENHDLKTKILPTQILPTAPKAIEPKFEDVLYTDAEQAAQILENRILGKIHQKEEQKTRQETFWSEFYSANSDLKAHERAVQLILKDKLPELTNLPKEEGQKRLASEVRSFLSTIRGSENTTITELPKGTPVNLGTSGSPHIQPSGDKAPTGPKNFAEQVRTLNSKRGRVH